MGLSLAIFSTPSRAGRELREQLAAAARAEGFTVEQLELSAVLQLPVAARTFDVVVLDATIEEDGASNYAGMSGDLMMMDHVLIVSRSYLPLNVKGSREQSEEDAEEGQSIPQYPSSLSNDRIVKWVTRQIRDIKEDPRTAERRKGLLGKVWPVSPDTMWTHLREQGHIFISFRGEDASGVRQLKARLESELGKKVLYFPPGVLSSEFMTEQRRWQLVAIIRDRLMSAEEVWLYDTAQYFHDYYYNSWWTLAELVTLASLREEARPRVRLYDASTQQVQDAPEDFLPRLTEAQRKRLARWFSNSTPDEMGPESVPVLRMLGKLPVIKELVAGTFYGDRVWSEEWWHHPVLDCYRCRTIGHARHHFDVDDVLYTRGQNFTRFTPEQVEQHLREGTIACGNPNCRALYDFEQGAPHYLWTPLSNAGMLETLSEGQWKAFGPSLLRLSTYLIQ